MPYDKMKSIELKKLEADVKNLISNERMGHTMRVVELAVSLADKHGVDAYKAKLSALAHDMGRGIAPSDFEYYIKKFQIDSSYCDSIELIHGKISAGFLKYDYGIYDKDILNAVSYHTTGRWGMSELEKIIYVADSVEPKRAYDKAAELRELAFRNLNDACLKVIEATIEYLNLKGCKVHEDTIMARNFFRHLKGEKMNNKKIALKIASALSAKKARDLMVIDVVDRSSFADYLVIATGGSERQLGTLALEVTDQLIKEGILAKNVEGKQNSGWILMDYGDIIVNIFSEEQRGRYNIEKIWGDCCFLDIED